MKIEQGQTRGRPDLVEIFHAAQRLQYGDIPPEMATEQVVEDSSEHLESVVPPSPDKAPSLLQRASIEARTHPVRYVAAGISVIALLGFTLHSYADKVPENASKQGASTIIVGNTAASQQEQAAPTGDPMSITFDSLVGKKVTVGSLLMNSVGGNAQIVYTHTSGSTGSVALPRLAHQENIEIYAEPLLSRASSTANYTAATPITVAPEGDTYSVNVDRSKVGVLFDYTMPGTYTANADPTTKATTVTLATKDTRDVVSVGFLAPSSTPLAPNTADLTSIEINRVNSLSTATDTMATIAAKIISLKESANYLTSIATNGCFAQANDQQPADTTGLIQRKIDTIFKDALNKWASDNHRTLYLNITGNYTITTASALEQFAAAADVEKDTIAQAAARDANTIKASPYANYFGVSAVKMTCVPDKTLKP
jgi:hypothetical protein